MPRIPTADVKTQLYMCATDFDLELGEAADGIKVYSSLNDLKKNLTCVNNTYPYHCGIYEVEVRVVRVIQDGEI